MLPNVVEINGNDRYLHKDRGFMAISSKRELLGRIPLDDLSMVLLSGYGSSISANLLSALAERCVPVIICNSFMLPVSITLPVVGHHLQSYRMAKQVLVSLPTKKRLWQNIIKAKIYMQAQHLAQLGKPENKLFALMQTVRTGDTENVEGYAASYYWPHCFGKNFVRRRETGSINALLNYGFTILRGGVARSLMLTGLHPAFGIFHHNSRNSMPLVDDIMEPFRPIVDMMVIRLKENNTTELTSETKKFLVKILHLDVMQEGNISPVFQCIRKLTTSLAAVYEKREKELSLPEKLLPLSNNFEELEEEK